MVGIQAKKKVYRGLKCCHERFGSTRPQTPKRPPPICVRNPFEKRYTQNVWQLTTNVTGYFRRKLRDREHRKYFLKFFYELSECVLPSDRSFIVASVHVHNVQGYRWRTEIIENAWRVHYQPKVFNSIRISVYIIMPKSYQKMGKKNCRIHTGVNHLKFKKGQKCSDHYISSYLFSIIIPLIAFLPTNILNVFPELVYAQMY